MNNIKEDAKSDWMKIVKKHKKKQKGLPSLSTLNTNAGNVEKSIDMFNDMQPDSSASVDSVNGNVSASDGCCESLHDENKPEEILTLEYNDLPIEVITRKGNPTGYYDRGMGQWYPDDDETKEILVDWNFKIDKDSVIEFLQDDSDVMTDLDIDNLTDEEYEEILINNFDALLEKYMSKVLDNFYEDAVSDAQKNYYYYEEEYPEYDHYDEEVKKQSKTALDDNFDMSMRTLL